MIDQLKAQTDRPNIQTWLDTVVRNALKKRPYQLGEIEHCIHFFESTTNADKALTNISLPQAIKRAEKWVNRLNQEAVKDVESEEDVETFLTFPDGFEFVKLKSEAAYKREGKLMSHCVASYYGNKRCEVYSLRDKKNQPHCTIELQRECDEVNQVKGKGNGEIHPKYINMVLQFLDKVGKPVRASEMEYLGYTHLDDDALKGWNEIKHLFYDYKELRYDGEYFLYKHAEPKRI